MHQAIAKISFKSPTNSGDLLTFSTLNDSLAKIPLVRQAKDACITGNGECEKKFHENRATK